jgi:hypothetical protein
MAYHMSQPKKRNPWKKRLLAIFLVIVVILGVVYWRVATDKYADTKQRKEHFSVGAFDLLREFQAGDSSAKAKYNGKILTVSGIVSAIEPVDTAITNIKFIDPANGNYAIFAFQEQHAKEVGTVKVGDSVSIKAAFSDYTFSSVLEVHYLTFQRATLNN